LGTTPRTRDQGLQRCCDGLRLVGALMEVGTMVVFAELQKKRKKKKQTKDKKKTSVEQSRETERKKKKERKGVAPNWRSLTSKS